MGWGEHGAGGGWRGVESVYTDGNQLRERNIFRLGHNDSNIEQEETGSGSSRLWGIPKRAGIARSLKPLNSEPLAW